MGGADHASARYIFTKLEPIARAVFHPDDDELLTYLQDDGTSIEPEYYMPVIPMVLCNGAQGIGTGWSTKVPNYSPRDIIANIRRKIGGEEAIPMDPFYSGFNGEVQIRLKFLCDFKFHQSQLYSHWYFSFFGTTDAE
jgi:DNA topoisomerase II